MNQRYTSVLTASRGYFAINEFVTEGVIATVHIWTSRRVINTYTEDGRNIQNTTQHHWDCEPINPSQVTPCGVPLQLVHVSIYAYIYIYIATRTHVTEHTERINDTLNCLLRQ